MNVFATYSEEDANISYWECGHDFHTHRGEKLWQRAERIPIKSGLKFFQCGANGKLALGKRELEHAHGISNFAVVLLTLISLFMKKSMITTTEHATWRSGAQ